MNSSLRAARLKKRWSVEQASNKAQVSVRTYQRWEHGQCLPHLSSLDLLCNAFEMSPEELGYGHLVEKPEPMVRSAHHLIEAGPQLEGPFGANEAFLVPGGLVLDQSDGGSFGTDEFAWRLQAMDDTQGQQFSRRKTLLYFAGLPLALQQLAWMNNNAVPVLLSEDTLQAYAKAIPACWYSYYDGAQSEVSKVLPAYITQLTAQVQSKNKLQLPSARLLSLAHQLASILALEQENFQIALEHCEQGRLYGKLADDPNLEAAALMRKVDVLLFRKRHSQRFLVLQEVEQYARSVSPLLRGRIYSGLAEIYAYRQDNNMAQHYIGLAGDTYPDTPERDPAYFYTHANKYMLFSDAGLTYLHLDQMQQARQAFGQAEAFVPATVNSRHVELLCWQTLTEARAGEQERSCSYLEQTLQAVRQLGSDVYFTEASEAYTCMYNRWKYEPAVRQLGDLFVR